ncbi:pirin family protein [Nocardioides hwasunensis]|uniref:Pirin family protein n=1 Tax=Nocardioides hwasunensis TaxID=397258 RepID=A0ABR8MCG9_9ACTN|nr:pirin family protein [Nocardioides hwasunensis]MBD3913828.1 pirin family protein [Nocardioides hwasunensis]
MTPQVDVLTSREVPLGGPRAMRVRRTLPQRHRSLIGAWCFVDHYGPDDVDETGGMVLPAHPHTGLQTASWLFGGELEHRDSVGSLATVRPGELNLMTAGRGISHTEVSTTDTTVLHGAQLWIALPDDSRHTEPRFEHFAPPPVRGPGWEARVFIGSAFGATSPVVTHTPLLGAEVMLAPGRTLDIEVEESFEHGVLLDVGNLEVEGEQIKPSDLTYVPSGRATLTVTALEESRLLLLGGPPFGEEIVMWWNFIGRTHEEIAGFREEWQQQITADGEVVDSGTEVAIGRFGLVDLDLPPIPAPELPNVRLKLRR